MKTQKGLTFEETRLQNCFQGYISIANAEICLTYHEATTMSCVCIHLIQFCFVLSSRYGPGDVSLCALPKAQMLLPLRLPSHGGF